MRFPDEPLAPIKPAALRERIAELRRELLIDAETIERIYQALVLGQHVILSGPPGTGKTRLAQLLPRQLWMSEEAVGSAPSFNTPNGSHIRYELTTASAYAVRVVTATDEWTPRHVIGGIVPAVDAASGGVRYNVAPGCLTAAILRNWDADPEQPASWDGPSRRRVRERWEGADEEYRGLWLVIDEFNRAPIDLALGEALTAIGGSHATLAVPTNSGPSLLRLPRDFRIIGTLNTFDRHFLNQISEALKRRFVFVEVLPPGRAQREAEQATVLRAALARLPQVDWLDLSAQLKVSAGDHDTPWRREWLGDSAARRLFEEGWRLFEVVRVYRQFGTAQAIAWTTAFLGGGLLKDLQPQDDAGWRACLSSAFADTLADQLQILFPDELEALLAYVKTSDGAGFAESYHGLLGRLISPKRRSAQMLALQSIKDEQGQPLVSHDEAVEIVRNETASVPAAALRSLFHADEPRAPLPEFAERLERFLFERMI